MCTRPWPSPSTAVRPCTPYEKSMTSKTKAILINCSIVAALIYRYWTGSPLFILITVGIFFLVFANLLMMFAAKQQSKKIR